MKALEEMTAQEILKAIAKLDRAMFAQPVAKQSRICESNRSIDSTSSEEN
jgi:hypothetical protein